MSTPIACLAAILLALLPLARGAAAAPLDGPACEGLQKQQADLEKTGAREHLGKGPEWARANLSREAIARVRQLIHVDEQLSFRCPRPKPVALTEEAAVGEIPLPARNPERPAQSVAVPTRPAKTTRPVRPASQLRPSLPPVPSRKPQGSSN